VIVENDCKTENALEMRAIIQGGTTIASLGERILGRTVAEDILNVATDQVIVKAGTLLDEPMIAAIEEAEVQVAKIRSPLVCEAKMGCAARAMAVTSLAVRRSISAKPWASSRRSRSASPAPS
jgi:DNA-directed RNA polymerase subunit beta'